MNYDYGEKLNKQYEEFVNVRKNLDEKIIYNKTKNVYNYFKNLCSIDNLKKNLEVKTVLYSAPVERIHGSCMVTWPVNENLTEIYLDENFISKEKNKEVVNSQITHELLHSLSNKIEDESSYLFNCKGNKLQGIDEATTQMFTEEIEGIRLNRYQDSLYFLKNVMRVLKHVVGTDKIASQYLQNDNSFEEEFNKLSNNKFNEFASLMNYVYNFEATNRGCKDEDQIIFAEGYKNNILSILGNMIKEKYKEDENVVTKIKKELENEYFKTFYLY